jgi:hypothetical protein
MRGSFSNESFRFLSASQGTAGSKDRHALVASIRRLADLRFRNPKRDSGPERETAQRPVGVFDSAYT